MCIGSTSHFYVFVSDHVSLDFPRFMFFMKNGWNVWLPIEIFKSAGVPNLIENVLHFSGLSFISIDKTLESI